MSNDLIDFLLVTGTLLVLVAAGIILVLSNTKSLPSFFFFRFFRDLRKNEDVEEHPKRTTIQVVEPIPPIVVQDVFRMRKISAKRKTKTISGHLSSPSTPAPTPTSPQKFIFTHPIQPAFKLNSNENSPEKPSSTTSSYVVNEGPRSLDLRRRSL